MDLNHRPNGYEPFALPLSYAATQDLYYGPWSHALQPGGDFGRLGP